jgi:ankyrin
MSHDLFIFKDYLTPLHVAAHCGNVKSAKLLLDRKCEVNARALVSVSMACYANNIIYMHSNNV